MSWESVADILERDQEAPPAIPRGSGVELPPLPEDKVKLDWNAIDALSAHITAQNGADHRLHVSRHGLGKEYTTKSVHRWQAESLAVWLGCKPEQIIKTDQEGPKREEAPVSARTVKLRGPLRSCSCGFMTDWPSAMGKHLKANPDHQEVTEAPKPKPEKPAVDDSPTLEDVIKACDKEGITFRPHLEPKDRHVNNELIALYLDRLEDRYAYRIEGCNEKAHADFLADIARLRELTEEVAS